MEELEGMCQHLMLSKLESSLNFKQKTHERIFLRKKPSLQRKVIKLLTLVYFLGDIKLGLIIIYFLYSRRKVFSFWQKTVHKYWLTT